MQLNTGNSIVKLMQLAAGLVLFFSTTIVYAAGVFEPRSATIVLPTVIDIPDRVRVGQVVWTSEKIETQMRDGITSTSIFSTSLSGANISSYGNSVYETGVEGLGFRIVGNFSTPSTSFELYFGTESAPLYWPGDSSASFAQRAYVEFIVISEIKNAGTIDLSKVSARLAFNMVRPSDTSQRWEIIFAGTPAINTAACTINNSSNTVDMGSISSQSLKVPGDLGPRTNFPINISCQSIYLSPVLTFDGRTDNEHPSVFANLSGAGYATGIGVQLSREDNVIIPRETHSIGQIFSTAATDYTFSARIYRLNEQFSAGAVDIPVTVTLSYN